MSLKKEKILKYSTRVPRYTSYPSALYFQEIKDINPAIEFIRKKNDKKKNLSLYIHLPFCPSLCLYCACTRVISKENGESEAYLKRLFAELEKMSKIINPGSKIVQVHFGGGTPTSFSPSQLLNIGKKLESLFSFDKKMEFAVELDPRRFTAEHAEALALSGCNRASIGIQDVHEKVQKSINRIQPIEVNHRAVALLRAVGIQKINADLMYGLPFQTPAGFQDTLDEVLTLDPDRFAIFHYAHIPTVIPNQKRLDGYPMPDTLEKFQILENMAERLARAGYRYLGLDHFAKVEDELSLAFDEGKLQRNFQGYTVRGDTDIYGFGMSAISQIGNAYLQSHKTLSDYYNRLDEGEYPWFRHYFLSRDDQIRRHVITRLMCDLTIDFEKTGSVWNIDAKKYFSDALPLLEEMEEDGCLTRKDNALHVTKFGRFFIRNIASAFDRYLNRAQKKDSYSKTI